MKVFKKVTALAAAAALVGGSVKCSGTDRTFLSNSNYSLGNYFFPPPDSTAYTRSEIYSQDYFYLQSEMPALLVVPTSPDKLFQINRPDSHKHTYALDLDVSTVNTLTSFYPSYLQNISIYPNRTLVETLINDNSAVQY